MSLCLQAGCPGLPRLWRSLSPPLCFTVMVLISLVIIAATWTFLAPHQAGSRTSQPLRAPLPTPETPSAIVQPPTSSAPAQAPGRAFRQPCGMGRAFPPNHRHSAPCPFPPSWEVVAGGGVEGKGQREGGKKELAARSPPLWAASSGRKERRQARPRGWCRVPGSSPCLEDPRGRGHPPAAPRARTRRRLRGRGAATKSLAERKLKAAGREVRQRRTPASRLGPGEKQPAKQRIPSRSRLPSCARPPHPRPPVTLPVTLWNRRGPSFRLIIK